MQKKMTLAKWAIMSTLVINLGVACKKPGEEPPTPVAPTPPAGFVYIGGNTFLIGSPTGGGYPGEEQPQHNVQISPFFVDTVEVDRSRFFLFLSSKDSVLITNPLERRESYYPGSIKNPVSGVSFNNALRYCNWLTKKEGSKDTCYIFYYKDGTPMPTANNQSDSVAYNSKAKGYRLLTEAEWEYACRAGTSTPYSFGNDSNSTSQYAYYKANSGGKFQNVGLLKKNQFGLYDMHGNVSEWVWDWYKDQYPSFFETNPTGPSEGSERVFRGGSYKNTAGELRSAKRFKGSKHYRYDDVGIRLAKSI